MPFSRYSRTALITVLLIGLAIGGMLIAAQDTILTPEATETPEVAPTRELLECEATLEGLWALVSDACAAGPNGFICNGGSAPQARPTGQIANSLGAVGALVETDIVDAVQTLPIITEVVGGGVMWFRWEEPHYVTGLIVGEAVLFDVSPEGFDPWTSMIVQTGTDRPDCPTTPHNTFVLEAQPDIRARQVVNGVSIDITGAIVIRTIDDSTVFAALSGRNSVIVQGRELPLWTGQQVVVGYAPGNFSQPIGLVQETAPLDPSVIEYFPTGLLDQPVWLPQPGYVTTENTVNLRTEPSLQGGLIGQVPGGELLAVLGRNDEGDWLHVSLSNGISGWMFAELLNANLGNVDAVYAATPQPPQRFGELNTIARVRAPAGLNVRENPSLSFPAIGILQNGVQVTLLARSPYSPWVKVADENGSEIGWVALIALDTRANVAALPVDTNVPPPPAPPPPTQAPGSFGNAFPDPSRPSF
jgi:uncharacterized protein YgiM (DUF1202 family)